MTTVSAAPALGVSKLDGLLTQGHEQVLCCRDEATGRQASYEAMRAAAAVLSEPDNPF